MTTGNDTMAKKDIKLAVNPGVELSKTDLPGVSRAVVLDVEMRFELTWDRFIRLHRTAEAIKARTSPDDTILDLGGFDGALALFMPEYQIDVVDPITTGGTCQSVARQSYDVGVSIDSLEHVHPEAREQFLEGLTNAARQKVFINFPGRHTAEAQRLIYELTGNPLVKEHVVWQLPCMKEVQMWLEDESFESETLQHSSLAQWISQYLLQTESPEKASKANRVLLEQYLDEPAGTTLYDMVIAQRSR
jgi:hypothetical protein